jgi:diacylglycerol kinase (ATP)
MIIVNPVSGAGRHARFVEGLEALALSYGQSLHLTSRRGEATEVALAATRAGERIIIVGGGDDTVREVLRGMYGPLSPLKLGDPNAPQFGILPMGTFNNFARCLGLPDNLEECLRVCFEGREARIDLGTVNGTLFTESVGVGIGVAAFQMFHHEPRSMMGRLWVGFWAAARALYVYRPHKFQLTADGKRWEQRAYNVMVANSKLFSAAFLVAPRAEVDDGLLDLCILPTTSRYRFLAWVPLLFFGKHLEWVPDVSYKQVKEVRITARRHYLVRVDGTLSHHLPVRIKVVPGALFMRLPERRKK